MLNMCAKFRGEPLYNGTVFVECAGVWVTLKPIKLAPKIMMCMTYSLFSELLYPFPDVCLLTYRLTEVCPETSRIFSLMNAVYKN